MIRCPAALLSAAAWCVTAGFIMQGYGTAWAVTAGSTTASEKIELQREGAAWRITITGSLPPQPLSGILAVGDLTIRGSRAGGIRYTVTQRVVGADEASVRRAAEFCRARVLNGQIAFFQPAAIRVEIPVSTPFVSVSSAMGMIDAADLNGSVRADAMAGRVMLDRVSGDVEIHSNGGPASVGTIGGSVRCYSGGGPIRAVRIKGNAYFETNGGDIRLGEVGGEVRAFTAAGGIRIDRADAGVFADTLGGPIEIGGATAVQSMSAAGAIHLNNVSGSLQAVTESGGIVAELLPGGTLRDSSLSTRAGDITVWIPSNMGVTIDAECSVSQSPQPIVSDFAGLRIEQRRASTVALGKINGGGPRLRLTGVGGRIEIRRK